MKIILKKSKIKRLKRVLNNNNNFFIITNNSSIKTEDFIKFSQSLFTMNLYCYAVNNQLLKSIYKKSIFLNFVNSISGSVLLLLLREGKNIDVNLKVIVMELKKYNIDVIGIYYNYQIYSMQQLKSLQYLNYGRNIQLFYFTLRNLVIAPVYKFLEKK